jgi:hypothetical protein
MVASGVKAKITCIHLKVLPVEFAGRNFGLQFLADLPAEFVFADLAYESTR